MTTLEFLAAVRAYAAEQGLGLPSHVAIHFYNAAVPLTLPLPPVAAVAVETPGRSERSGLDSCTADILATLRAAGRPLTKTRLVEEMCKRERAGECGEYSPSTIERRLALLMEDETLDNPRGVKPPGYRLAEEPPEPSP